MTSFSLYALQIARFHIYIIYFIENNYMFRLLLMDIFSLYMKTFS